jgi:ketosteroid isomerase-like protein
MRLSLLALPAVLLTAAPLVASAEAALSPAVASLVESERTFSRTAGERGVKESFLQFFGEDSINFQPEPGPALARIREWPQPQRAIVLSWEPVFADVSHAGDMGYTTGPTLSHDLGDDPRPDRHGYYFSVWRKQGHGDWKVALDVGVATPGLQSPAPELHAASAPGFTSSKARDARAQRTAILALEQEPGADATHAAEESRLHRDGMFPVLGRTAVVADLARRGGPTRFEPAEAVVSESADFAYSYGAFTRDATTATAGGEHGYYAHVWKRTSDGAWQIVAQIEQLVEDEE